MLGSDIHKKTQNKSLLLTSRLIRRSSDRSESKPESEELRIWFASLTMCLHIKEHCLALVLIEEWQLPLLLTGVEPGPPDPLVDVEQR